MINRLGIEGIDGAGKTTTCEALVKCLEADGLQVVTFAPYRMVNEYLGEEIYNLWFKPDDCVRAIRVFKEVIDTCEVEAQRWNADVVIYDRHWMTALTAFEGNETGIDYWEQYGPEMVPVALLRVPVETALERRADEIKEGIATFMEPDQLGKDAASYGRLARQYGQHVLGIYRSDDDVTPEQIARSIAWDMQVNR